ncbi:MAG: hybrid sensor histidine kinase/response regulator [Acidimicrobiales bacterium]
MTDIERRRRPRIRWVDRSIRSKALVVLVAPTAVLAVALGATAGFVSDRAVRGLDVGALVLALLGGLLLWHSFTTGVISRLRRLEHDTDRLEGAGPRRDDPTGRDEIGRLAARLDEAAVQIRRHEAERDRAERELADILTASPVVALRYDVAARRFSYASPNIARLLGISAEQAMADPDTVTARFHPDDARALRDAFVAGHGRGEDRVTMILRCRHDPQSTDWHEVEAVYTLVTDDAEVPVMVSSYLVDVSERHIAQRAAEERRFMLESIFHASPDTIVVRDAAGKVILASSSLAELVGAPGVAQPGDELIDEAYRYGRLRREERVELEQLITRCMSGERNLPPVVTTGRVRRGPSGFRTFETRARPIFDEAGNVNGTVTVSRDISERVNLEGSLRRATTLAERASEAKSQFLSRMSHELRTPLNAILGFAQLLELDGLPGEQASSVDQIQRAGRHLLSLINEVLDIARIEAGQLSIRAQAVRVGDVLEEVTTLLSPVAESAAVHMMVDASTERDCSVRADRQRLLQVLLNLGSNAVKYNDPGGTVAFHTTRCDDGGIRFSVHDTGPGIPHEQQDLLFVPFSRLGAERSAVEGTGVGLALSKQLVEVMGGSIGVESAPGRGSTFWVELLPAGEEELAAATDDDGGGGAGPARPERPASRGDTGRAAANGNGKAAPALVVLHVEDNPSNASFVAQVLAKRPLVRLVSAADAHMGLELARQHRPQLLLLDLHLPDLSGDEMLYRIKGMPELADTSVVVVSADATPARIRRMLDLGVQGYLTKPVDVEALLALVDEHVAHGQSASAHPS